MELKFCLHLHEVLLLYFAKPGQEALCKQFILPGQAAGRVSRSFSFRRFASRSGRPSEVAKANQGALMALCRGLCARRPAIVKLFTHRTNPMTVAVSYLKPRPKRPFEPWHPPAAVPARNSQGRSRSKTVVTAPDGTTAAGSSLGRSTTPMFLCPWSGERAVRRNLTTPSATWESARRWRIAGETARAPPCISLRRDCTPNRT